MNFPIPPLPPQEIDENDGVLNDEESSYILDTCLKPKSRRDPLVIQFIAAFVKCKHIAEASSACGVHSSVGYKLRHRMDISNAIQKIIDKSLVKYGFDASELVERTKEIVDFDPLSMQNADGTYKDNLMDIEPAARRNLKKLKVQNLYQNSEDKNGMKSKIIVGKVIEYEFYDKLKAIEMVGKEKDLFKTTTRVEHDVTKNMASVLLASAEKGKAASLKFNQPKTIEAEVRSVDDGT